jgi:competence protein ComEA
MPLPGRGSQPPAVAPDARLDALRLPRLSGWVPQDEPEDEPEPPARVVEPPPVTPADLGAPLPSMPRLGSLVRSAVADRVPAALRGARVELSWAAMAGIALLCVACVAVAVVGFIRARAGSPAAADLPPPPPPASMAAPAGPGVVVDVAGHVHRPGLVTLPGGARVADALRAAGGATRPADVALLNLARRLVDGEQLLVGVSPPPGAAASGGGPAAGEGTAGSPLDLNAATLDQLDALPGVGPVLAQRIVDWRTAHNGFTSVDQLRQVGGIGGRKFDQLRPLVRV